MDKDSTLRKGSFRAIPSQEERLKERHGASPLEVEVCGFNVAVFGGVYKTSADTELMAESVRIESHQTFLERPA